MLRNGITGLSLLLLVLGLLITLPVQQVCRIWEEVPLNEGRAHVPREPLTFRSWFAGSFQESAAARVNLADALRPTLTRLSNQLTFSLFKTSPSPRFLIGQSGYLFEKIYLDSYTGRDRIPVRSLINLQQDLTAVSRELKARGKPFLLVWFPNKCRIYPEFLPADPPVTLKEPSNYQLISHFLEPSGLHILDFNRYFSVLRDTALLPLFPRSGVHWSNAASSVYALDTLITTLEYLKETNIRDYRINRIEQSDTPRTPDGDILEAFNLMSFQAVEALPYVIHEPVELQNTKQIRVIYIGDSFFWNLYGAKIWPQLFDQSTFWFYNVYLKLHYPEGRYQGIPEFDYLFWRKDLLEHEAVVLLFSEPNISRLCQIAGQLKTWLSIPDEEASRLDSLVRGYSRGIRSNADWLGLVKEKAGQRGIPLEEMILRDAYYLATQKMGEYSAQNRK